MMRKSKVSCVCQNYLRRLQAADVVQRLDGGLEGRDGSAAARSKRFDFLSADLKKTLQHIYLLFSILSVIYHNNRLFELCNC